MKSGIKNLIGCIVTIALIVIMVAYLGHLTRPIEVDRCFLAIDAFHSVPEDSVEVMIYGSSHAWYGVKSMEMYEEYGIGAYNYGNTWQHGNTTELFLADSFRTQSPKVVLIETYRLANLLRNTDVVGEVLYTKAIPHSETKQEYLTQLFGDDKERWLSYYVPLSAFHQNWENLEARSFEANAYDNDFYQTMGWWEKIKTTEISIPDQSSKAQKNLHEDAIAVLDDMMALCKENDVEVVFFTTPWQGVFQHRDAIAEYAEQNGCTYLNLFEKMDEVGLDVKTDFMDEGHLNANGATKVANYLGAYLAENYELTDMRTIENNIWEQALAR